MARVIWFALVVVAVWGAPVNRRTVVKSHGFTHTFPVSGPLIMPVVSVHNPSVISFLELQSQKKKDLIDVVERSHTRDEMINDLFDRNKSEAGLVSRQGISRGTSPTGIGNRSPEPALDKELREARSGPDYREDGRPEADDYTRQHANDLSHHEINVERMEYDKMFKMPEDPGYFPPEDGPQEWHYKGALRRLQSGEINPPSPAGHPGVQPLSLKPSDLQMTGADFETAPPEPLAPMPPYLYPPQSSGEFDYNVPPMYKSFYPTTAPTAHPGSPTPPINDCVPVKNLPYVRSLSPASMNDDYCVPSRFMPYYHPIAQNLAQPPDGDSSAENGYPSQTMQPVVSSPQFDLPMPFAHGPMFPAFELGGVNQFAINPPPAVPLPAPANYNGNARRSPPMPMPPLPPSMWPYS